MKSSTGSPSGIGLSSCSAAWRGSHIIRPPSDWAGRSGRCRAGWHAVASGCVPTGATWPGPFGGGLDVAGSPQRRRGGMPATLANSTVRLALTIGAARALAIGVVPVAVVNLARGVIRTMFVNKVLTTGVAALLAAGVIAAGAAVYAFQAAKPDPADCETGGEAKRRETGGRQFPRRVADRHGRRPHAGRFAGGGGERAIVHRVGRGLRSSPAPTKPAGFSSGPCFGNGCNLHVSSADGSYQAVVRFRRPRPAALVRPPWS